MRRNRNEKQRRDIDIGGLLIEIPFSVHLTFQRLTALWTIFAPTAIKTRLNNQESHPPSLVVQLIKKSATAR
jgi:hypothetical protein